MTDLEATLRKLIVEHEINPVLTALRDICHDEMISAVTEAAADRWEHRGDAQDEVIGL